MTFSEQLKADIALIEPALESYLSRETGRGLRPHFRGCESTPAMAGGKRLRPVIVLEFCRLRGGDIRKRPAVRVCARDDPYLFAHPRRPAVHGQRRSAPRPSDLPQGVRRGDGGPRGRRSADRGVRDGFGRQTFRRRPALRCIGFWAKRRHEQA